MASNVNICYNAEMSTLNQKTEKYAYPCFPEKEDKDSFYFPDSVIDPFVKASHGVSKDVFEIQINTRDAGLSPFNRHRLFIPDPQLSWKKSCALVIAAFEEFHPDLGAKAREVIKNNDRWKLKEVKAGEAGGRCHPANCETNQESYAVIEYAFDGTINDAVYIAHELGHLIADDYRNKAGFSYHDEKQHMFEVQAFFTQNILYDYLKTHPDPNLSQASQSHFIGEITSSFYSLPIGVGALEAERAALSGQSDTDIRNSYSTVLRSGLGENWHKYGKAKRLLDHITDSKKRDSWGICDLHKHSMASIMATGLFLRSAEQDCHERSKLVDTLFGEEVPKDILEIFGKVGVHTKAGIRKMAKDTVHHIAGPVMAIKNPKQLLEQRYGM
ncbi:MAG: hypothetical protein KAJ40_02975 [Alphaproteobacteria bacterium]|nr:hypothetical protein [Alphaproteobacteria bacterium]